MTLGLLLTLLSLEALFMAKDKQLWQQWQAGAGAGLNEADYRLLIVFSYGRAVLIPSIYGLYVFIADRKLGMTRLGVSLWTLLLAANWIMYLIRFDFDSLFYYPIAVLLLLLQIRNRKLLE